VYGAPVVHSALVGGPVAYSAAYTPAATVLSGPVGYAASPVAYAASPVAYAAPATVISGPAVRAATLTRTVLTPGHSVAYRVDK
jgi:hypothetical protein